MIGVAKAYTTRVGEGPFPTELFDETGSAMREVGQEFGTTTGRERRCGWLDLVALKYAVRLNGITHLALTKLDVLTGLPRLKVCTRYLAGDKVCDEFPLLQTDFHHAAAGLRRVARLDRRPPRLRDIGRISLRPLETTRST